MGNESKTKDVGRRALLGGGLALGGYVLLRKLFNGGPGQSQQWLEIVQDKYSPEKWYVNLYEGPVPGDLSRSVLKSHRIEFGSDADFKSGKAGYPARVWYSNGEKESVL